MKNYISKATLALLVALSATGCSDFLDEKLKSELAPDNTYTSSCLSAINAENQQIAK